MFPKGLENTSLNFWDCFDFAGNTIFLFFFGHNRSKKECVLCIYKNDWICCAGKTLVLCLHWSGKRVCSVYNYVPKYAVVGIRVLTYLMKDGKCRRNLFVLYSYEYQQRLEGKIRKYLFFYVKIF